jgi:hypothetical protein
LIPNLHRCWVVWNLWMFGNPLSFWCL